MHGRHSINAPSGLAECAGRASPTREASAEGSTGVALSGSQAGSVSETGSLGPSGATCRRLQTPSKGSPGWGGVHGVFKHVSRKGLAFCSKPGPRQPQGG